MQTWMSYALVALFVVSALVAFIAKRFLIPPRINLRRPKGHPLLGNMPELTVAQESGKTHEFFNKYSAEFGRKFGLWVPGRYLTVLSDTESVRTVLNNRDVFLRNDLFQTAFQLVSNGLLVLDGEVWRVHRKMVAPAFNPDHLRDGVDIINGVADHLLTKWEGIRASASPVFNVHRELSHAAIDVIGLAAFDQNFDAVRNPNDHMSEIMNRMTALLEPRVVMPRVLWAWMLKDNKEAYAVARTLTEYVMGVIQRKKADAASGKPHKRNLLDMLLDNRKSEGGEGSMTDEEIRDEVIMFFLAGHETTANTMSWIMYVLAEHPDVVAKIQAELDRVLGKDGKPTYDEMPELVYLEQVIKEVMRLYPVASLTGRRINENVELAGVSLPAGSNIIVNFSALHHDPEYWPNPEKFDPERFAKDAKIVPGSYLPFGDGPASCIGQRFAMLEMKTFIARIYHKYNVTVVERDTVEFVFSITLGPKNGLKVKLAPRQR